MVLNGVLIVPRLMSLGVIAIFKARLIRIKWI